MENYTEKMTSLQMQISEAGRTATNRIEDLKREHKMKVQMMTNNLALEIQKIERSCEMEKAKILIKIEELKNKKKDFDRKRYAEVRAEIQQLVDELNKCRDLSEEQKCAISRSL